jgi:hypothetical protein
MAYFFGDLRVGRPATAYEAEILFDILHSLRRAVSEQQYRRIHGLNSRTISTTARTFSTGVSGRMP